METAKETLKVGPIADARCWVKKGSCGEQPAMALDAIRNEDHSIDYFFISPSP